MWTIDNTPIGIRNLKKGDKIKTILVHRGSLEEKNTYETEEFVTYDKMDGMYAKLYTSDGELVNVKGYVKQENDYFIFCDRPKDE